MPDLQFLEPASFGPSTLPFSQGVRAGNLIFVAGQGALDDDGNFVGQGDVREQTRVTLDRVRRVLEEAGGDLSNVVSATVFLTDLANFGAYNEAWVEAFGGHRPARATVRADLLFDMLVEVQADRGGGVGAGVAGRPGRERLRGRVRAVECRLCWPDAHQLDTGCVDERPGATSRSRARRGRSRPSGRRRAARRPRRSLPRPRRPGARPIRPCRSPPTPGRWR